MQMRLTTLPLDQAMKLLQIGERKNQANWMMFLIVGTRLLEAARAQSDKKLCDDAIACLQRSVKRGRKTLNMYQLGVALETRVRKGWSTKPDADCQLAFKCHLRNQTFTKSRQRLQLLVQNFAAELKSYGCNRELPSLFATNKRRVGPSFYSDIVQFLVTKVRQAKIPSVRNFMFQRLVRFMLLKSDVFGFVSVGKQLRFKEEWLSTFVGLASQYAERTEQECCVCLRPRQCVKLMCLHFICDACLEHVAHNNNDECPRCM